MSEIDRWLLHFTDDWRNPVGAAAVLLVLFAAVLFREQSRFIFRSLQPQFAAQRFDRHGDVRARAGDHARLERAGVLGS